VTRGSGGGNFILEKIFTSPDLKLPLYYSQHYGEEYSHTKMG